MSVKATIAQIPPPEESGSEAEKEAAAFLAAAAAAAAASATTPASASTTAPTTASGAAAAAAAEAVVDVDAALATAVASNSSLIPDTTNAVANLSNPWEYDDMQPHCAGCSSEFNAINRRHHCRLCGKIFCGKCSDRRALIPPSSIVLVPRGGKKAKPRHLTDEAQISFNPDPDPDRMLTYTTTTARTSAISTISTSTTTARTSNLFDTWGDRRNGNGDDDDDDDDDDGANSMAQHSFLDGDASTATVLYGKGLEERFLLAREPLRVCDPCHEQLLPLQEELRQTNSNAMRYNHIDPTDARRLLNSPLAFTLGHEVRKAAYTLNNLLPMPKRGRLGALATIGEYPRHHHHQPHDGGGADLQNCREECSTISPSLGDLDGVRIPARLLEDAKGIAVLTVAKGGFGIVGGEFGTGLVVARLPHGGWSAPSAIGTAGVSWGALFGAQVSDHVFLLMTDSAVEMLFHNNGSLQLGADVGVAVGPLGRSLEGNVGASPGRVASIYTYSLSKGLYAGASLDSKLIVTRHDVNERFYGRTVSGSEILSGELPTPPAAQPLYDALTRCHVYATRTEGNTLTNEERSRQREATLRQFQQPPRNFADYHSSFMNPTTTTTTTAAATSGSTGTISQQPQLQPPSSLKNGDINYEEFTILPSPNNNRSNNNGDGMEYGEYPPPMMPPDEHSHTPQQQKPYPVPHFSSMTEGSAVASDDDDDDKLPLPIAPPFSAHTGLSSVAASAVISDITQEPAY